MDDNAGDSTGNNAGNSRARGEPRASSPQRPICSRWIPYIPAAVPAKCSSKNNSLHLWPSFWSIFLFSSVMCHRHTPSSKRNLSSKIFAESAAIYFFPLTKWFRLLFSAGPMLPSLHMPAEITARSKVDISRVARLFGHNLSSPEKSLPMLNNK